MNADTSKKSSIIWKHFTNYRSDGNETYWPTCKKCDKRIKCSTGSTSSLFGLLKFCDPKVGKDAEVERIEKRRKLNDLKKAENKEINSQTKIDDMFSMFTLQFNNSNPKAKAITRANAEMVAIDYQPYSLVFEKS